MDLKEITESFTPWTFLLADWHKGKKIDRNDVIKLLKSGKPIPLEANEFLAKALTGRVKFKRGIKPLDPRSTFNATLVVAYVDLVEAVIKNPESLPDRDEYKEGRAHYKEINKQVTYKESQTTARKEAKIEVAKTLGISVRRVESLITKRNNEIKRMADKFGVTVSEMKAALE